MNRILSRNLHLCAVSVTALGIGCSERQFQARSKVNSPRILAIIADRPEIRPGEIVSLRLVTGGLQTGNPSFHWTVCTRPEATTTFTASSTFGVASPDQGCFSDASMGVIPSLPDGPVTFFGVPADLLSRPEVLQAAYGANLSASTLDFIARVGGLPITIAVEMTDGTTVVQALKRVVIRNTQTPNTNPPSPSFRWTVLNYQDPSDAGSPLSFQIGAGTEEDTCAATDSQSLRVPAGARVEIAPDPTEDRWLEDYDSLDSSGRVTRQRESGFYAFFSTNGYFSDERTRIPTRNTIWTAPQTPGESTHWIVVRDGRGGASACKYTVNIYATP